MVEDTKIGVFLCDCGEVISRNIDLSGIRSNLEKISDVGHVALSHYLCSQKEIELMGSEISEKGLNRVVIGGCSPQFCEVIFMEAMEKSGLNPYLLSIANIRDQCGWVHPGKTRATSKAARQIKMAISKARFLEPIKKETVSINRDVLIIGGGISGMEAAIELSELDHKVTLLEREKVLGGKLHQLYSLYPLELTPGALLAEKIEAINKRANIEVLTTAELLKIEGHPGNFVAKIQRDGSPITRNFGAIVVATGCDTQFPRERYGLELSDNIITQLQFERMLKSQEEWDKIPQKIGFMLDISDEYSRISTISALRNGLAAKRRFGGEVYIFCKNLKLDAPGLEGLYREARDEGVIFFKFGDGMPTISPAHGQINIQLEDLYLARELVNLSCDLLVVDEKIIPQRDFEILKSILNIDLDSNGFYQQANVHLYPVSSIRKGIFSAGSCRADLDFSDALADGRAAAQAVHQLSYSGKAWIEVEKLVVDADKCALCLTCIRSCPHHAIEVDHEKQAAKVIDLACQGCGICAAECPAKAIQHKGYTDNEIGAQLEFLEEAI